MSNDFFPVGIAGDSLEGYLRPGETSINFVDIIKLILEKAKRDDETTMYYDMFSSGVGTGYISALEDLLAVLTDGDRNRMNRPEYYTAVIDTARKKD